MSYYKIILELIENMVQKDDELEEILKRTEILYRENIELKEQVKESERKLEEIRLRSHTIDYMLFNYKSATALINPANQDMTPYIRLKRNLEKIDFSKILRADLIDIERTYREEWQKMQAQFVRQSAWREKMEQRHIVQEYYRANTSLNKAKQIFEETKESLQKSLQESQNMTNAAYAKRSMLIVALIDGSKELRSAQEEHYNLIIYKNNYERLQKRKLELQKELNKLSVSSLNKDFGTSFGFSLQGQFRIPEFPSFTNILQNLSPSTDNKIVSLSTITILQTPQASSSTGGPTNCKKIDKHVHFKKPITDVTLPDSLDSVDIISESSVEFEKPMADERIVNRMNSVDTIEVRRKQYDIAEKLTATEEKQGEKSDEKNEDSINLKNSEEKHIYAVPDAESGKDITDIIVKNRLSSVDTISESSVDCRKTMTNKIVKNRLSSVDTISESSVVLKHPKVFNRFMSHLNSVDTIPESSVELKSSMAYKRRLSHLNSMDTISESSIEIRRDESYIVKKFTVRKENLGEKSDKKNEDAINLKNSVEKRICSSKPKIKVPEKVIGKPRNIVNEMKISTDKCPVDIKKSKTKTENELPSSSNQSAKDSSKSILLDFDEYLKTSVGFLSERDSVDDEKSLKKEKKNDDFFFSNETVANSEVVDFNVTSGGFDLDSSDDNDDNSNKNFL
uniref:Uncharacterized protein n=1 Tax=Glossina brevipalpis TaxID=37001 RepID=A0A1A9X069_9MUSC